MRDKKGLHQVFFLGWSMLSLSDGREKHPTGRSTKVQQEGSPWIEESYCWEGEPTLGLFEGQEGHVPSVRAETRSIASKFDDVCVYLLVTPSCLTLCNSMDCSPSGSSVHGILQARKLEWVAIPFSRWSIFPIQAFEPRSPAFQVDSLLSEPTVKFKVEDRRH